MKIKIPNVADSLVRFESDFLFFQAKLDSLRENYLNKYVAIHNKEIIASGTSIQEIEKQLKQKNVDVSSTVVEFVPSEEAIMVL